MTDTITMVYFNETLHTPNAVASAPYRTLSTDANGVPTFAIVTASDFDGHTVIPASQTPAGWAISSNYANEGEVDIWSTVNSAGPNQGVWFWQKTGASTVVNIGAFIGDATFGEMTAVYNDVNWAFVGHDSVEAYFGAQTNFPLNFYINSTTQVAGMPVGGGFDIYGSTSGHNHITVPAAAGTPTHAFTTRSGTIVVTPDTPVTGDTLIYDGTDWRATIGANYSYNTPLTGATVTMGAAERRCIINPAGALAALTVVLPPSPGDGQIAGICSSQVITALTTNAGTGGAAVVGAPAALSAGQAFTMLYRSTGNSWYISA